MLRGVGGHAARTCPGLQILASSRQPLGIVGEHRVGVPPLSVPGSDQTPSLEELAQYDAVSLFVDRAATVHPGFAIDDANHVAVRPDGREEFE